MIIDGTAGPIATSDTPSAGGGGDWISSVIGLGTMLWNNYQQRQMMEQQNAYNRQSADTAWQRQLDFWNMQNEYNSPSAQMERYRRAGLNENLVFGGGNPGNAGGLSHAPVAQQNAAPNLLANLPNMLTVYQDYQLKHAQIDNVKAQTDAVRQKTINETIKEGILKVTGDDKRFKFLVDSQPSGEFFNTQLGEAKYLANSALRKNIQESIKRLGLMDQNEQINMLRMDEQRRNLQAIDLENEKRRADIIFKQNENLWREKGITSSDNVMLRILVRLIDAAGIKANF